MLGATLSFGQTVLATLAGGGISGLFVLIGIAISSQREHTKWLRQARFDAYSRHLRNIDSLAMGVSLGSRTDAARLSAEVDAGLSKIDDAIEKGEKSITIDGLDDLRTKTQALDASRLEHVGWLEEYNSMILKLSESEGEIAVLGPDLVAVSCTLMDAAARKWWHAASEPGTGEAPGEWEDFLTARRSFITASRAAIKAK